VNQYMLASMVALHTFASSLLARLRREEGQDMAEYALLLVGIALVVALAAVFLGGKIASLFSSIGNSL
jgi:Flp pilus assembly pilin Flp